MIKAYIHSYLRGDGRRVPWKIAESKDELQADHEDDRIEEVWVITEAGLKALKRQEIESVMDVARDYCDRLVTMDIKEGETCTGFDLLNYLEEQVK